MASSNIPNLMTWARVALAPIIAALIVTGFPVIALAAILIAALLDFLDGYIARRTGSVSEWGRVLDPVADKILVAIVLVALVANGQILGWHLIPAITILMRDMLVSGMREGARAREGEGPVLPVSIIAKWKTTFEFLAAVALVAAPLAAELLWAGLALLWIAAAMSLFTGARYAAAFARALR